MEKVIVIGCPGAGKSTFLNAVLFGDIILPVDADETTRIPTGVRYGENAKPEAFVVMSSGERRKVACIDADEPRSKRLVKLVKMLLTRCGKRGERSSVEAVVECDDGIAVVAVLGSGIFARDFYGALVGFGAGVREEHLFHTGLFAKQFGKLCARLGIIEVGHMLYLAYLFRDGFLPFVVGDTERGDADSRAHVYIFFSVDIGDDRAFARHYLDGKTVVGGRNVFFICFDNIHIH